MKLPTVTIEPFRSSLIMQKPIVILATTMSNARAELATYSSKQDTAANVDAGSVFLVLIPVSAFAGDSEADVAKWKGRVEAIETAQIKKKCPAT